MMSNQDGDKTRTHVLLQPGTMVAHYHIEKKIGAGGMGEVFLAEDTKLKRRVALKFLPTHLAANETVRSRFVREAQMLAKLNHPNIVSIYEVGDLHGRPYYSMELIEGESLHDYAHKKQLSIDTIIDYAIQICQGLGEAHRAGIIHRDIKAANIAVDKNHRIRLLDFGLAVGDDEEKLTKTGSTLGTVAYMSPEQASGRDIDHRSDLFSLGVVLYELIAGRSPFNRGNEGATIKAILTENPEPLSRYKTDVPEKLQQIISELLEKDKEIRYQSAEGVIAGLKRLIYDSQQTSGFAPSTIEAPSKSRKGLLIGVSVAVLAVIVVAAVFLFRERKPVEVKAGNKLPMIAVLPFENLGAAEDEYFADGMTEEITSRLAGITGLGVISRTSAIKYKGTDKSLKQIGEELGVQYILEGTVRWSKEGEQPRVRITPQLIEVADDRHIWADNYERALMDVFAVQADIAAMIVGEMGMTLIEGEQNALGEIPTRNTEAYQLYLKSLSAYRKKGFNDSTRQFLDSAVHLDPQFALAYALLSSAYSNRAWHQPHSDTAKLALSSARRALELQPDLPQGHLALGYYYHWVETDYDKAMEEFSIAESKLPNDPELLSAIAWVYARQANLDKATEYQNRAVSLDPLDAGRHISLCNYLVTMRRYKEAAQSADRAIALEPDKPVHYRSKIVAYQSWYGEVDSLIPIAVEALRQCDTMKFAESMWDARKYLPVLPWDSLIEVRRQEILSKDSIDYEQAYAFFRQLGDKDLISAYADSAKDSVLNRLKEEAENPYAVSSAGLLYSYLGECKRAVELGLKGKAMLTYDDCFM